MKKWEETLADLGRRLDDWQATYDREAKRLYKERGKGLFRRVSAEEAAKIGTEATAAAGTDFLVELGAFFDEIGDFYLTTRPDIRGKIRARIGAHPGLIDFLWQYATDALALIRGPRDGDRLRHALVALSIDDHRVHTRQLNQLMGELWVTAKRAKLDPNPILQEVALVSNPGSGGGGGFTQAHLLEFPTSRYFREHVQPRLRAGAA